MDHQRYNVKFPVTEPHRLQQDEAFFSFTENEQEIQIRFHDYGEIYKRPDLYEQVFYERLKCGSPKKVCSILEKVLRDNRIEMTELRVLHPARHNMTG
ncbi:MAG: hypothetical protein K9L60_13365 [Methylovulum sp.]|nr:hypothetical protein [Methylovulum sp.]